MVTQEIGFISWFSHDLLNYNAVTKQHALAKREVPLGGQGQAQEIPTTLSVRFDAC